MPAMSSPSDPPGEFGSYLDWSDQGRATVVAYTFGAVLALLAVLVFSGFGVLVATIADPGYESSPLVSNAALFAGFAVPFLAVPGIVRWLNRRPGWSVAMPQLRYEGWHLWVGFGVGVAVGLVAIAVAGVLGAVDLRYAGFDWSLLLPLVLVGFIGIFIQAGAEEMVFRGYLTQFARRFTARPWLFIGIPAILFALPHAGNIAAYSGNPLVLAPYLTAGLLYGWAAYRSGSLWLSLGLHLSNNLSGLVLVGTAGDVIRTAAPLTIEPPSLMVVTLLIAVQALVTVAVLEWLLRRRGVAAAP